MEYTKGITHAGIFHADDVLSSALLKIIFPKIKIQRLNNIPDDCDESTIIYDIGFGRFDHHQKDAAVRDNGIKYSSFGLIWKEYGKILLGEKWIEFDRDFVRPIDIQDNGGEKNLLSDALIAFNPNWDDNCNADEAFEEAVDIAKKVILKFIQRIKAEDRASDYIHKIMENSKNARVIVMNKYVPWQKEVCRSSEALYVIYPSLRGDWNAQAVPEKYGAKECRLLFPSQWLKIKPLGITFMHSERFLISSDNKESLVKLCEAAILKHDCLS